MSTKQVNSGADACRDAMRLLTVAVELHRGGIRQEKAIESYDSSHGTLYILAVTFALGEKAPEMSALIINGKVYLTIDNASVLSSRERERLRTIVRHLND